MRLTELTVILAALTGTFGVAEAQTRTAQPASSQPLVSWADGKFAGIYSACGQDVSKLRRAFDRNASATPFVPAQVRQMAEAASGPIRLNETQGLEYLFSLVYTDPELTNEYQGAQLFEVSDTEPSVAVRGTDLNVRRDNCVTLLSAGLNTRAARIFNFGAALDASVSTERTTTTVVRGGQFESAYAGQLAGDPAYAASPAIYEDALAGAWLLYRHHARQAEPSGQAPVFYIHSGFNALTFAATDDLSLTTLLSASADGGFAFLNLSGSGAARGEARSEVARASWDYATATWNPKTAFRIPSPEIIARDIERQARLELSAGLPPPPGPLPEKLVFRIDGLSRRLCVAPLWDVQATLAVAGSPAADLPRPIMTHDKTCSVTVDLAGRVPSASDSEIRLVLSSTVGDTASPRVELISAVAVPSRQSRLSAEAATRLSAGDPEGIVRLRYEFTATGSPGRIRPRRLAPTVTCGSGEAVSVTDIAPGDDLRWDDEMRELQVTYRIGRDLIADARQCTLGGRFTAEVTQGSQQNTVNVVLPPFQYLVPQPARSETVQP